MSFVADQWSSYAENLVPAPPGSVQYEETRKAFYAGAIVILGRIMSFGDPSLPEKHAENALGDLERELRAYYETVTKGNSQKANPDAFKKPVRDREMQRRIDVGRLRCEASGWDEASCLAMLDSFTSTREIAVAWFRHLTAAGAPHRDALDFSIVAHQAALSALLRVAKRT